MNTHANRKIAIDTPSHFVTTPSEPFALKYERLDPESLRRITAAVEAAARRMRAQVIRDMLRQAGRFVYRSVAGLVTPAPAVRHERLSS